MKTRTHIFTAMVVMIMLLPAGVVHTMADTRSDSVIAPALQFQLEQASPKDQVSVIVTLSEQVNVKDIGGKNRDEKLRNLIIALSGTADRSQSNLRGLLASAKANGDVSAYTSLWITNAIAVTGNQSAINMLAHRPEVQSIALDQTISGPEKTSVTSSSNPPEQNLAVVNAPALWSLGYQGQGIVVANMDTGVDYTHPDLNAQWRGGTNSWYDPYNQHPTVPVDYVGHGTWTMGVMVGRDAGGTSIGMAPQASWIAVKIFNDSNVATMSAIHLGFQWLLNPDGNLQTNDAPNLVNNSWDFGYVGCDLTFEPDLQALVAASITPVFAAGNYGPNNSTSVSPANNPDALAVGAIDNNSVIYSLSSRGPTNCGQSTITYPAVVAPGVSIRSSDLYGSYYYSTGTSLAAPHVSGALALLLSAFPNLGVADQRLALSSSAVDLGQVGLDNTFGSGRIDILAAYNLVASGTLPTATPTSTPTSTTTPTATFTPSPSPTSSPTPTSVPNSNLALNQPVTVSSFQDLAHNGSMSVDGNLSTQWQTKKVKGGNGPSTEWIEVNLGTSQDISQVILKWNAYYATNYNIQTSKDETTWSTVFSTLNGDGGNDTITFNTVQAQYVRMITTAWNTNSNRNWLNELEVYSGSGSVTITPTPTLTPTSTSTPAPTNSVHVGDLDSAPVVNGGRWNAVVYVTVHDAFETPLPGVIVNGNWSNGTTGSGSCTTSSDGTCSITRNSLKSNLASVTFTVTGLDANLPYYSSSNHDPDGDSNGSVIMVYKP